MLDCKEWSKLWDHWMSEALYVVSGTDLLHYQEDSYNANVF